MKTIGSILLDVELVTQDDIEQALGIQKQTGQRLGEILVGLDVVSDDDIRWALAEQLNLPYVNIRKDQIDIDVATMLPEKLARRYHVIPILRIGDELTVVVDDPLNTTVLKDIETITKLQVKISLGRTSDIMMAIDEIYGRTEEDLASIQESPPRFLSSWFAEDDVQKILNDPSGHALLERLLINAFTHGVSRIHFQPGFETNYINYRIRGVVRKQVELGKEWFSIIMFRLKVSAGFEISQTLHPQYKEFSYWEHVGEQEVPATEEQIRIAVSIFPTAAGEAVTLYIINKSLEYVKEVEHRGILPSFQQNERAEIDQIKAALHHMKSGAIFLAGSPYPDKITTLYSMLQELDYTRKKIMTFEAYTEYSTDKYYQIRYAQGRQGIMAGKNPSSSEPPKASTTSSQNVLDFDTVAPENQKDMVMAGGVSNLYSSSSGYTSPLLSQVLNPDQKMLAYWFSIVNDQDADVVLVDHIESHTVLSQCLDYAVHHLVLGAFGCKHIFEVLAYCLDCQIPPSVLTSRLYALLAQQSVLLLCEECKQKDTTDFTKQFVDQLLAVSPEENNTAAEIFVPVGCPACHGTGYTQHVVLFEILKMDPWIQEMLMENALLAEMRRVAGEKDFSSIRQKSKELFLTGKTSLEQIFSIVT